MLVPFTPDSRITDGVTQTLLAFKFIKSEVSPCTQLKKTEAVVSMVIKSVKSTYFTFIAFFMCNIPLKQRTEKGGML